jgi:hypothetical protein
MSKIKVGQIYELPFSKSPVVVIRIEPQHERHFDWVYLITDDGQQERLWRKSVEETLKLIAEYPTWQEAVNSKEFNNETI